MCWGGGGRAGQAQAWGQLLLASQGGQPGGLDPSPAALPCPHAHRWWSSCMCQTTRVCSIPSSCSRSLFCRGKVQQHGRGSGQRGTGTHTSVSWGQLGSMQYRVQHHTGSWGMQPRHTNQAALTTQQPDRSRTATSQAAPHAAAPPAPMSVGSAAGSQAAGQATGSSRRLTGSRPGKHAGSRRLTCIPSSLFSYDSRTAVTIRMWEVRFLGPPAAVGLGFGV